MTPYQVELRDILAAKKDQPEGLRCGYCYAPNNFADDIGWFYLEGYVPTCRECYNGSVGQAHRQKYGVGDR